MAEKPGAKIRDKQKKDLSGQPAQVPSGKSTKKVKTAASGDKTIQSEADILAQNDAIYSDIFDTWDGDEFEPTDFMIDVPIDSLESAVGYTSLFRQFHQAFVRSVAFYQTPAGGTLSVEEARKASFHPCKNIEEAKKHFKTMMRLPLECLNFIDLEELHQIAPRVAERFWERAKDEGNKEFISGHLGANINFPVGYMKQLWNVARYLGVRDSFIAEWNPQGGIEVALIDMMTQSYFQWQYWLEQTVKRSQTREREQHPEYSRWMANRQAEYRVNGWTDGYWFRPYVSEKEALDQAVQMADRFNRIFLRTLRQLRDLRRYTPVTINNPTQVNIAADGGQQVNVSNEGIDKKSEITS